MLDAEQQWHDSTARDREEPVVDVQGPEVQLRGEPRYLDEDERDSASENTITTRAARVRSRPRTAVVLALAVTSTTMAIARACSSPPARLRPYVSATSAVIASPTPRMSAHCMRENSRTSVRVAATPDRRPVRWNASSAVGWMMASSHTMWIGRYSTG